MPVVVIPVLCGGRAVILEHDICHEPPPGSMRYESVSNCSSIVWAHSNRSATLSRLGLPVPTVGSSTQT
jgi:hypothetical protein